MQNNFKCSRSRQFSHDLFAPSALKPGIEIQKKGEGGKLSIGSSIPEIIYS